MLEKIILLMALIIFGYGVIAYQFHREKNRKQKKPICADCKNRNLCEEFRQMYKKGYNKELVRIIWPETEQFLAGKACEEFKRR